MSGAETRLIHTAPDLVAACDAARARGARVGIVPTMGALHEGHLSLVRTARERGATFVVVTIFVNPLQFGPNDDFDRYPRTLETDLDACRAAEVDVVFAPERDAMYPPGFSTTVSVTGVTDRLEGVHRPGHFDGVTTIVTKLMSLASPCIAVFGRKDYQQWKTLERMARDLALRVEVVGSPIVREADGLALSSRNRYLDADGRARALGISRGLAAAVRAFDAGERRVAVLADLARAPIDAAFDRIDYVAIADPETLAPCVDEVGTRALIAVAAHIESTRLIDNVVLGEPSSTL